MPEATLLKSMRPKKRKAPDGEAENGPARKKPKSKKNPATGTPSGGNAPPPPLPPVLPPIMAQGALTAEMAALGVQLPFYVQAINQATGQPLVDPANQQPVLIENWQDVGGFNDCALHVLFRLDPHLRTTYDNRAADPLAWQRSLWTLAGQLARTRDAAAGRTIQYGTIDIEQLRDVMQLRGLTYLDPEQVQLGNVSTDELLGNAWQNNQSALLAIGPGGATIADHHIAPNHYVLLERTDAGWALSDPNPNPGGAGARIIPVTGQEVAAGLASAQTQIALVSNTGLPAQAPELDQGLDFEFFQQNPAARRAVLFLAADMPPPLAVAPADYEANSTSASSSNLDKPMGYLRDAAPMSGASLETWRRPAEPIPAPTANEITHVILQLEDDDIVIEAASNLHGKHPDAARWLQADLAGGTVKAREMGSPSSAADAANMKLLVVGHSRADGAGTATAGDAFAGQPANILAQKLISLLKQLDLHPTQINLVGCRTSAKIDNAETNIISYAERFAAALQRQEMPLPVVGYDGWLKVDEDGRKWIKAGEPDTELQPADSAKTRFKPGGAIFVKLLGQDIATANRLRKELVDPKLDRQAPAFLQTVLAAASHVQILEKQTLYFLEKCRTDSDAIFIFAGQKNGNGYLVLAAEATLGQAGFDSATLQRGDKVSYQPGQAAAMVNPTAPLQWRRNADNQQEAAAVLQAVQTGQINTQLSKENEVFQNLLYLGMIHGLHGFAEYGPSSLSRVVCVPHSQRFTTTPPSLPLIQGNLYSFHTPTSQEARRPHTKGR
jgi:hypothetical protein